MRGKLIQATCNNCKVEFKVVASKVNSGKGKFCSIECYKSWRKLNSRDSKLRNILYQKKHKYGLSESEYNKLIEESNGQCKICKQSTSLVVDHDHSTGKVRGLLCQNCNKGLGNFKDDISILQASITYLNNATVTQGLECQAYTLEADGSIPSGSTN